eukprot:1268556-Pyramimonas_sp.AAC.1
MHVHARLLSFKVQLLRNGQARLLHALQAPVLLIYNPWPPVRMLPPDTATTRQRFVANRSRQLLAASRASSLCHVLSIGLKGWFNQPESAETLHRDCAPARRDTSAASAHLASSHWRGVPCRPTRSCGRSLVAVCAASDCATRGSVGYAPRPLAPTSCHVPATPTARSAGNPVSITHAHTLHASGCLLLDGSFCLRGLECAEVALRRSDSAKVLGRCSSVGSRWARESLTELLGWFNQPDSAGKTCYNTRAVGSVNPPANRLATDYP